MTDIEIHTQRKIASAELRYGTMRIMRSFLGWPIWAASFFGICAGAVIMAINISRLAVDPIPWPWGLALFFVSATCLGWALSMIEPYIYNTTMPGSDGSVKCLRCGTVLTSSSALATCDHCGSWFPIFFRARIARAISLVATIVNILIVATGFFIALV